MKKYTLLILSIVVFIGLFSCEENQPGELLKELKMDLEFTEYNSMPSNTTPYINKYFTPNEDAKRFIPNWLIKKYFSLKDQSTITLTYDFMDYIKPQELGGLSGKSLHKVTKAEYAMAWDKIIADFYSPSIDPESNISLMLNSTVTTLDGNYMFVDYNYSVNEPIIKENQVITLFHENFSGPNYSSWGAFNNPNWFNKITEGGGRTWSFLDVVKTSAPHLFSNHDRGGTGGDKWLVTKNPIPTSPGDEIEISFEWGQGYWLQGSPHSFHVLVTNSFDGAVPKNSTWTDITDYVYYTTTDGKQFNIKYTGPETAPSSGYPGMKKYRASIPSHLIGKDIYVAFRDYTPRKSDGSKYDNKPLYFLDEFYVKNNVTIAEPDQLETHYAVFQYNNGVWQKKSNFFVVQPSDYEKVGVSYFTTTNSIQFLPNILKDNFTATEGDNKIVVYLLEDKTTYAEDYIYVNGNWEPNTPPILKKTDRYRFDSSVPQWVFDGHVE